MALNQVAIAYDKTLSFQNLLDIGALALALALASEELLKSVGKWKATMILFATGLSALGVGLLVKVLFVR